MVFYNALTIAKSLTKELPTFFEMFTYTAIEFGHPAESFKSVEHMILKNVVFTTLVFSIKDFILRIDNTQTRACYHKQTRLRNVTIGQIIR